MQSSPGRKYAAIIIGLIFCFTTRVLSQDGDSKCVKTFVLPDDNQETFEAQLIIVTWKDEVFGDVRKCDVITDERRVDEILKRHSDSKILAMDREDFVDLLEDCKEVASRNKRQSNNGEYSRDDWGPNDSSSYGGDREQSESKLLPKGRRPNNKESSLDSNRQNSKETRAENTTVPDTMEAEGNNGWNVIFPGTKWCGAGDIAKNYDDLGFYADTDKCCRAHDLCDDLMESGETKNNLTNDSKFTKLSCQCDDEFYNCLERVDSVVSNKMGNLYFNILRNECYTFDYPVTKKCKKFRSFMKITCKEYEQNVSEQKVYQWVTPKLYRKLPIPGPLTITLPWS